MQLDEATLRRPGFEEGYWVELANGVRFSIPPVRFRLFPDDDGKLIGRPWYDGDLEDDLDILFDVVPPPDDMPMPFVEIRLKIAAALLKKNYDLPRGAVGRLLSYIPGDPASEDRLLKIGRAIMGRDPDAAEPDDEDEPGEDAPDPKGDAAGSDATLTPAGSG